MPQKGRRGSRWRAVQVVNEASVLYSTSGASLEHCAQTGRADHIGFMRHQWNRAGGCRLVARSPTIRSSRKLLRYTEDMTGKACHAFGPTTQLGLTQVSDLESSDAAT